MEIFANQEIESDLNLLQKWFEDHDKLPKKISRSLEKNTMFTGFS